MPVTTSAITPAVGLEISGMTSEDLAQADAAQAARRALEQHGVVVYRELKVSDADLVTFARRLGTLVVQPTGEHEYPEIQTITMDPAKTNAIMASYRQGNFHWHIDGLMDPIPQKATLLTARAVDPAGGDTEFANTYAAYNALSEEERAELADLRVLHSFAHAQSLANPEPTDKERAAWERIPTQVHPLVWKRRDGRTSLLVGSTAAEIVGWPRDRGRDLLDRLLDWATQPQFTLRQRWLVGDLVIWDNTGMLHRALPFAPTSVRLLHRTTLVGEEAIGEFV
jgi:alpha-ketoglutarate-dependent taurine dioxygenase